MRTQRKIQLAALVATLNGCLALAFSPVASAQSCGTVTVPIQPWCPPNSVCLNIHPPGCKLVATSCVPAGEFVSFQQCIFAPL